MTNNIPQLSSKTLRRKVMGGISILIIGVVIWYGMELFGGNASPPPVPIDPLANLPKPTPTQLLKPVILAAPDEAALLKRQQDMEEKYASTLNELKALQLDKELVQANKDLLAAKLSVITTEAAIIKAVTDASAAANPPAPTSTPLAAPPIADSTARGGNGSLLPTGAREHIDYTVISVSQIRYQWGAVLSYQGKLFRVTVGDTLPQDKSRVVSINKFGITLIRKGIPRKIPFLPII